MSKKDYYYSTDSLEHEANLLGLSVEEYSMNETDYDPVDFIPYEKLCPRCLSDEIYSGLTRNLCLNCYQELNEDIRMMEIECLHDELGGF